MQDGWIQPKYIQIKQKKGHFFYTSAFFQTAIFISAFTFLVFKGCVHFVPKILIFFCFFSTVVKVRVYIIFT